MSARGASGSIRETIRTGQVLAANLRSASQMRVLVSLKEWKELVPYLTYTTPGKSFRSASPVTTSAS